MHDDLAVELDEDERLIRVVPRGALDLATAGPFEWRMRALLHTGKALHVDLRDLSFIDSVGISMLGRLAAAAEAGGVVIRFSRATPAVQQALDIVHAERFLPFLQEHRPSAHGHGTR